MGRADVGPRTGAGDATGGTGFRITSTLIIGYIFVQVAANLTVAKAVPVMFGLAVPIGSLLYAVSFTWIDLVNQVLGRRNARWLVGVAVVANACLALWFQAYIWLPGTAEWLVDNQEAVVAVLGGLPRVIVASLLTNLVVENLDITVYHIVRIRRPLVPLGLRSAVSNTVSAPVDGVLFALLAFSGTLPWRAVLGIAVGSALYKLVIGYLSVPLIYLTQLRRAGSH